MNKYIIVHLPNGRFTVEAPDGKRYGNGHYDSPCEFWIGNKHYIAMTQYYGDAIVAEMHELPTEEKDETL